MRSDQACCVWNWKLKCALAIVLLACASPGLRAQTFDACTPSAGVKAALDLLPPFHTPDQAYVQFHEQKLSKLQALLQQYPNDLFVERAYIQFQDYSPDQEKVSEQYKARHDARPDDPQVLYLYGLTVVGHRTPEAIKLFEEAIEKSSKFAWPHLALVQIYTSPSFLNKEKSVSHMKAFLGLCPSALDGYERLTRMDDKGLIAQGAEELRKVLQNRSDPEALGAFSTLWSLEFKARPPAEHAQLRQQVGEDVKRIRSLNLRDKSQWYKALEEGYKLMEDKKDSDWAKDERVSRFPRYWELASMTKWHDDNPYLKPNDPPEKRQAYYNDLLKQTAEWLKARPNASFIWYERLEAMEHVKDVPVAEIEAAADQALKADEANAGPWGGPESDLYFGIARVYSKKNIFPERVVNLARKGLERLEVELKIPRSDLYATKDMTDMMNFYRASERIQGLRLETDGYLRSGQADKAQLELAQLFERLKELKSLAGDKEDRKKDCSSQEASYWGLMARLAELHNRKQDAMAFYETALLTRLDSGNRPEAGEKDELADNAHTLWGSLGGTDAGWKTWYGSRAAALEGISQISWDKANEPLPLFEIADIHGKTWKLADLRGKVVLLNVWASW